MQSPLLVFFFPLALSAVMAGLGPAIHEFASHKRAFRAVWLALSRADAP
jgi:hypothetical protein